MHTEFYKFISGDKQPPAFKLHFQCVGGSSFLKFMQLTPRGVEWC